MAEMYSGLHVRQQFSSLDEFKTVIRNISVRQHWELRVSRSNKKSVVIGCRSSPNCYFRVVCRANQNATYISSLQDSHSCRQNAASPGVTPARAEASHVRFLLSEIPRLFDMRSKIRGQDVVDAVKRYHGYDISMRQAQRALIKLQPRQSSGHNELDQGYDRNASGPQRRRRYQSEQQRHSSEYSGLSEERWISDQMESGLVDNGYSQQNGARRNPGPSSNQAQHAQRPVQVHRPSYIQQPVQVETLAQPHRQGQGQGQLSQAVPSHSHLSPMASDQVATLPPLSLGQPNTQTQPHGTGNPGLPQMLLTSFKIEFSCTTCGALNQSFFPNQGNVTNGSFLPQNPPSDVTNIVRQPVSPGHNGPENTNNSAAGTSGYSCASPANTRDLQSSWTPGALSVSIHPTHT